MLRISTTPLRRVNKRGSRRATGRCASTTMGKLLDWESYLEEFAIKLFDVDFEVKWIFVQALHLRCEIEGRLRSHWPDICVFRAGVWEVHEVKPDSEAESEEVKQVAAAAARLIRRVGIVHQSAAETHRPAIYNVIPERVLVAEPLKSNVEAIRRCRSLSVGDDVGRSALRELRAGPLTLAELADRLAPLGGTRHHVYALVTRRVLCLDLKAERLSETSLVWLPEHVPFDHRLIPIG